MQSPRATTRSNRRATAPWECPPPGYRAESGPAIPPVGERFRTAAAQESRARREPAGPLRQLADQLGGQRLPVIVLEFLAFH